MKHKRCRRVGFRCNTVESQALAALADLNARSESETLRELIRETAKARGLWPVARPRGDAGPAGAGGSQNAEK